jgi:hypothetical protein
MPDPIQSSPATVTNCAVRIIGDCSEERPLCLWYMAQSNPSTPSRAGKGVAAYIRCHESGTPPPRRSQSRKSPRPGLLASPRGGSAG